MEFTAAGANLNNNGGTITGGDGGIGGGNGGVNSGPGGGGLGGVGVIGTSLTITSSGTIRGGNGGNGGDATPGGSQCCIPAGDGAAGIAGDSNTITNTGAIHGGNGGNAGANTNPPGGSGGHGITGSGLTITNAGTITAGLAGSGGAGTGPDGKAILFTGGTNRLELWAGSTITGVVDATAGASNTFALGGTTSPAAPFDVSQIGTAAQYRGFTNFELTAQTDATVWKLTGTPSQATPWNLIKGVLSVGASDSLGTAASSALTFNGGTLQVTGTTFSDFGARTVTWGSSGGGFDIADKANTFTVSQDLSGGPLAVNALGGLGALELTRANIFTATDVYNGALLVDQPGSITSPTTTVHAAGTLGGTGAINGDVSNFGTVAPGYGLTAAGAHLNLNGNYIGNGGTVAINTALGDSSSTTDQLIVNNGTITGTSGITVTNLGGTGDVTTGNGIPIIVALNGTTTSPNAFTLVGPVKAGPFQYVFLRGMSGTADEQNSWYVCSTKGCLDAGGQLGGPFLPPLGPPPGPGPGPGPGPSPNPDEPLDRGEVAMHAVYGAMARQLGLLTLGTFHERNGDQQLAASAGTRTAAWGRVFGQHMEQSHSGDVRPHTEGDYTGIQAGIDAIRTVSASGHQDRAGLFAAYANADVDVSGYVLATPNVRVGRTDLDATSFGAYWSHLAPTGWYTDAVIMGTAYDGDGRTFDGSDVGVSGSGFIASLEGGFPLLRFGGFKLEQQAQLVYQYINLDEANDPYSHIAHDTPDALHGRVGWRLSADGLPWMFRPFLKANIWQDFAGKDSAIYEHTHEIVNRHRSTTLELGGGVVANIAPNMGLWASADYTTDIGGTEQEREGWRGTAGLRITW